MLSPLPTPLPVLKHCSACRSGFVGGNSVCPPLDGMNNEVSQKGIFSGDLSRPVPSDEVQTMRQGHVAHAVGPALQQLQRDGSDIPAQAAADLLAAMVDVSKQASAVAAPCSERHTSQLDQLCGSTSSEDSGARVPPILSEAQSHTSRKLTWASRPGVGPHTSTSGMRLHTFRVRAMPLRSCYFPMPQHRGVTVTRNSREHETLCQLEKHRRGIHQPATEVRP